MTKHQIAQQLRQIESIFDDSKKTTNIKVIESNKDYKCDVHGRRLSNGSSSVHSSLNKRDSITSISSLNRRTSAERTLNGCNGGNSDSKPMTNGNKIGPRRESMPVLNGLSNYYNRVYVPIVKPESTEQINPAAFPSILRKSSISLSQNTLRGKPQYNNYINHNNNNNLSKSREHIYHSTYCEKAKPIEKTSLNKRNSFCGDLRRNEITPHSGNSIYLRRDSSGNINLIRRDSIGSSASRRNSITAKDIQALDARQRRHESVPRDYVSGTNDTTTYRSATPKNLITTKPHSILRKKSPSYLSNDNHINSDSDDNLLTKDNLKKHVTLLDCYGGSRRRSSIDSGGSSTTRRISIDSLDLRRNSWDYRGSDSSSEKVS